MINPSYIVTLALESLRRDYGIPALICGILAVGVGSSVAIGAIYRTMSADPIPTKSRTLIAPQIDSWGVNLRASSNDRDLPDQLSYTDAVNLVHAREARRQAAMYATTVVIRPSSAQLLPIQTTARATYRDFFQMFEVPILRGAAWSTRDEESQRHVAVISRSLSEKLFGHIDVIGRSIVLNDQSYAITGVTGDWSPSPHFYDLNISRFSQREQVFLPFTTAIDARMSPSGNTECGKNPAHSGIDALLRSECVWIQFWVELPTAADLQHYRVFLLSYFSEQRRIGRFHWPPHIEMRDVTQWLRYQQVIPAEIAQLLAISLGFLLVCAANASGLLLARFDAHSEELRIRRILGASWVVVFNQCLVEAGLMGAVGGIAGLGLAAVGLLGGRTLLPAEYSSVFHLDITDALVSVLCAISAALLAALYPAWRTAHVQPASILTES